MEQNVICTDPSSIGGRLEEMVSMVSHRHNEYHHELGDCFLFCQMHASKEGLALKSSRDLLESTGRHIL